MILIYIIFIFLIFYNIKIFKLKEYNKNPLNIRNSNAIKGLASLSVVLHHLSQKIDTPGFLTFFRYVGYLSVSLFFFYSAYGLMKSLEIKKNYLNEFWTKRIPKIIIPFLLSNILFLVSYTVVTGARYSLYDIFIYIFGIKLLDSYKWYIITMIILYSSFYFIFKYFNKKQAILSMFLLITAYACICFLLQKGEWWYNTTYCFVIGIIFGEYYKEIFNIIQKYYSRITISILSLFLLVFVLNIFKTNILTSIISSIFFVLICICLLLKLEIGNKIINFFGSISYEIYLIHRIVLDLFSSITNNYIYLIVSLVSTILIAYIFSIFIKNVMNMYMNIINKKEKSQS